MGSFRGWNDLSLITRPLLLLIGYDARFFGGSDLTVRYYYSLVMMIARAKSKDWVYLDSYA